MSSEIIKRKSNAPAQVKSNQIAKIKSNEKTLAISSPKPASTAQKSALNVNSTTKDDEGTSEETSGKNSDEDRHYEIEQILDGSMEDALGRYNLSSKKDIDSMFRQPSGLAHPDKEHDQEWKTKAKLAQQKFTKSRDFLVSALDSTTADSTPEDSPPAYQHDNFWGKTFPSSAVRSLQINPESVNATFMIGETNKNIKKFNSDRDYPIDSGVFPIKYFKAKYSKAHSIMNKYQKANDQQKNGIKEIFEKLKESIVDNCSEHGFPQAWTWQHSDVTSKPQWLDVTEKSNLDSHVATLRAPQPTSDMDTDMTDEKLTTEDGITPDDDTNTDTTTDSTNSISSVTVNGKIFIAKRAVFKTFQYLIQEADDLRVWVPAQSCGNIDPENIETVTLKSKEFLKDRKYQYSSTLWVALGIDDVVCENLRYPAIAMMVEWLDEHPDSLLWRSDVIKIADKTKTHNELMDRLNYQQGLDVDDTKLIMMAASERALNLGSLKLFAKISGKKKQITLSKVFEQQSSPQSSASKNSPAQSNEKSIRIIVQEAVEAALQAKLQSTASVQLPS